MRLSWLILLAMLPIAAHGQSSRPDPTRTPGALNPAVTQENIDATICQHGWAKTVRPPRGYTSALKRRQLAELGYPDQRMADYEEDHLIPLELGGAPADERNLWPQPRHGDDGYSADEKDELERVLNRRVCHHAMDLALAQQIIARSWINAYHWALAHAVDDWDDQPADQ